MLSRNSHVLMFSYSTSETPSFEAIQVDGRQKQLWVQDFESHAYGWLFLHSSGTLL